MNPGCTAAMLLSFDIDDGSRIEHDDWHSHEHMLERLAIPGFLRGSRWTAVAGAPRYFVLYEVSELAVLESAAYLERLNQPSAWTTRMMPAYRGMQRGLCHVRASAGRGLGGLALLLRYTTIAAHADAALCDWLGAELLPTLPRRAGLVGAQWLESALQAPLTTEQRLRGVDAAVDRALVVSGYDRGALQALAGGDLSPEALQARGATGVAAAVYQLAHVVTAQDLARGVAA